MIYFYYLVRNMEETRKKIGSRIKELRVEKLKVSQEDFARSLNVDRTYLSRVESGKQNITMNTLSEICDKLGISLKEFFSVFD